MLDDTSRIPHRKSLAALLSGIALGAVSLCAFPTGADAKMLADFDEEIAAQQAIVDEKTEASAQAQKVLADTASWYYKNISTESITDMLLGNADIAETIDKLSYMSKIYDTYSQKVKDAEKAKAEAIGAKEALEALKEEKASRARSLEDAYSVQFSQGGDNTWSSLGYWSGTVASAGCGLCSYTVIVNVLTGADYTPTEMLEIRGDWRGMDGYPDDKTGSGKKTHHDYTLDKFDIETWNIDTTVEDLKNALKEKETAAMVCSRGNAFKNKSGTWRWSSGHFVAVLGYDEEGFHVADSAYGYDEGANVVYTDEEMARMLRGANHITVYSN